jgi:tetrahydromethanopterin S-methyltransferase subunit H
MAVTHIAFNDQLTHGRILRRGLNELQEGRELINEIIATMATMLNGDGTSSTHFDYFLPKFGFSSNADAKSAWDELNSLASKFNTDASVTNVQSALLQAFNKFR